MSTDKPVVTGPVVVVIRDGWGCNPHPEHAAFDAVRIARERGLTPVADGLMRDYPWTLIKTSGEDVGLPEGTMGNSEVGHQNIGAGRIVDQESVAITKACRRGLEHNEVIAGAIRSTLGGKRADGSGAVVHLLCIASDAGVHGQIDHLLACVRACKALGQNRVGVHLMMDGRDTGPFTGQGFVAQIEAGLKAIGVGRVCSVMGRYFAMDRDNRWERVKLAYECLVGGGATPEADSAAEAVAGYYARPSAENMKGDEFITPTRVVEPALGGKAGGADWLVQDGDAVVFVNYRGDRPRELSAAFVFPDEAWAAVKASPDSGHRGFDRGRRRQLHYVTMTAYWEELAPYVRVAFPKPPKMVNIAGEYVSRLGLSQFRCAETEKYPHVTFFFNDYRDEPFAGEHRQNPQSPKVSTYDQKPEMSAEQVAEAVLARLAAPDCEDLLVVNFANADMVGHTGVLEAAVAACAAVDACVGRLVRATLKRGGSLIVTADHGNAEQMFDPATGSPHTAHTIYDVPLIVVGPRFVGSRLRGDREAAGWFDAAVRERRGRLADILPTALAMLGLPKPAEMTGESLLSSAGRPA